MKRAEHSSAFSALAPAKAKLILLGTPGPLLADLVAEVRSFPIEHVSPASLVQQEISRRTTLGQQAAAVIARSANWQGAEHLLLAIFRKWFWARKPDAGFLLEGFPATLLQAKVFDEWLEARGETLQGVLSAGPALPPEAAPIVTHYRTQGLLLGDRRAAA